MSKVDTNCTFVQHDEILSLENFWSVVDSATPILYTWCYLMLDLVPVLYNGEFNWSIYRNDQTYVIFYVKHFASCFDIWVLVS